MYIVCDHWEQDWEYDCKSQQCLYQILIVKAECPQKESLLHYIEYQ